MDGWWVGWLVWRCFGKIALLNMQIQIYFYALRIFSFIRNFFVLFSCFRACTPVFLSRFSHAHTRLHIYVCMHLLTINRIYNNEKGPGCRPAVPCITEAHNVHPACKPTQMMAIKMWIKLFQSTKNCLVRDACV